MSNELYPKDSRSHVGDGLTFHGNAHRDTDIPWPKQYIDERAHYVINCQLMDEQVSNAMQDRGCRVYLQMLGSWNGNDVYRTGWNKGQLTGDLGRACNLNLEQSRIEFAAELSAGTCKPWSAD